MGDVSFKTVEECRQYVGALLGTNDRDLLNIIVIYAFSWNVYYQCWDAVYSDDTIKEYAKYVIDNAYWLIPDGVN